MKALAIYVILYFFQIPQFPVIPAITPLAGLDSLPPNLSDLPAANVPPIPAPSQYFAPAVILPSLPMNPTLPMAPNSPALPMQAVNLPHTTVASLVLPCQTIVPNMSAATIPLLAVAPPGVPALPPHHVVPQLSQQQMYPATFQQIIQSEAPSPHHTQGTQAVSQAQQPQSLQPSIIHPSEQPLPVPGAGHQVMLWARGCRVVLSTGDPGAPTLYTHSREVSSLLLAWFVNFLTSVLEVVVRAGAGEG